MIAMIATTAIIGIVEPKMVLEPLLLALLLLAVLLVTEIGTVLEFLDVPRESVTVTYTE